MRKLYFVCLILFIGAVGLWLTVSKPPRYGELLRAREWKLLQIKEIGIENVTLNLTLVSVKPTKPYIGVENGDKVLLVYPEDFAAYTYWFKELEIDVIKNLTIEYSLYGDETLYPAFLKEEEDNVYVPKYTFFLIFAPATQCQQGEPRRCKTLVNLSTKLALVNELRGIDYFPVKGVYTFYFTLHQSPLTKIQEVVPVGEIKIRSNGILLLREDFE